MKKALKTMALLWVMALSAGMFTGCVLLTGKTFTQIITGKTLLEHAIDAAVDAAVDAAEEDRQKKAVEIVTQYDEIESF